MKTVGFMTMDVKLFVSMLKNVDFSMYLHTFCNAAPRFLPRNGFVSSMFFRKQFHSSSQVLNFSNPADQLVDYL